METSVIWLEETDSTNSEARRRISELENLSIIAALKQTAGRGQGSHIWTSAPGENLTFTLLLDFGKRLNVHNAQTINDIVTEAIVEMLSDEGIEGVWVKKPNDIWVGDRKIAGILIENILEGDCITRSLVGIGLDVNQTDWPCELPNPASMKQLTGREYDINHVLQKLCTLFEKNYLCAIIDKKK